MSTYTGHPVRPAIEGPQRWPDGVTATAGRDHVVDAVRELLTHQPGWVACDIESVGKDGAARYLVKVITFATPTHTVALDPRDETQRRLAATVFDLAPLLVFHNAAFDVPNLGVLHILEPRHVAKCVCTLVYARLAEPNPMRRKSLGDCAHRYLGAPAEGTKTLAARSLGLTLSDFYALTDIDAPAYLTAAMRDAVATARLYPVIRQAAWERITRHRFSGHGGLDDAGEALRLLDREQTVNRVFLRRTIKGLRGDPDFLDAYRDTHDRDIDAAATLLTEAGIRPGNGNDLIARLVADDALPPGHPKTKGGKSGLNKKPSAAAEHLETLAHPLAKVHVAYAKAVHIRDDYLEKASRAMTTVPLTVNTLLPWARMDSRLHPSAGVLSASATGRMSYSGDFPVHQIPPAARGVVRSDEGRSFTSIDWAQIEPVVLANVSGDTAMLEGYELRGEKLYDVVSAAAGVPYKAAKVILLAAMYGESIKSSAVKLDIPVDQAEAIRDAIFGALPRSARTLRALKSTGDRTGQVITISGRVLDVPWFPASGGQRGGYAGYKGQNYFVQGSAYDVLAETVVEAELRGYGDAVYLAMHDELVVDDEAAHDVRMIMSTPPARLVAWSGRVPVLRTDAAAMGDRWASV